jgi:quinol monooxygenase YgiN
VAWRSPASPGFVVIVTWTAKEGEADRIRMILEELTPGNRAEPKMIHVQAQVSAEDPDTFVIFKHYTGPSGYDEHRASEPFRTRVVGEALPDLLARRVDTFTTIGN